MEVNIYSIYDVKAKAFLQPFFSQNNATAIRSFQTACQDNGSQFVKYPEDYVMYVIATFHDDSGKIVPFEQPLPLCKALDFVQERLPMQMPVEGGLPLNS